jgi:hypothetical protein
MADVKQDDYTLEKSTDDLLGSDIPYYFEKIKLSDDDKKRLKDDIFAEWKEIKAEREKDKFDDLMDSLDNQYKGKLKENKARQFNIDRGVTATKVDKIVSDVMKAFTKQDPKFAITPRPELARNDGNELCQKQSDFIDDRLDNLTFYDEESKVVHNSVLKGVGILKITHKVKREPRKRIEKYEGLNELVLNPQTGQPVVNPQTGKPQIKNKGLEDFLKAWPDAGKRYPNFIRDLIGDGSPGSGSTIELIGRYTETTYNDPYYENIDPKDFYVRKSCKGLEGLRVAKLIVERRKMTYWELRAEEEDENFYDIDKIFEKTAGNATTGTVDSGDYKQRTFDILECTYEGKEKEGDKDEVKMKLWFEEETKVNIGVQLFPWFLIDSEYIPHYIMQKVNGFYQPGIGQRLTNNHVSENAIINFILEGMYLTNMVTPITDSDEVVAQFEDRKFSHGVPLRVKPDEIGFLQTHMKQIDYQGALGFLAYLAQSDDEKARSVQLGTKGRTGQSVVPLGETAMLVAQGAQGIEDFIITLAPAFNEVGYVTLNLYYEISKGAMKYRIKSDRVVGGEDLFAEISREDLIARTNIQVQAWAYAFDKQKEKQDNFQFMQTFLPQVLIQKNPKAVYTIIKQVIKSWSPSWRNMVDAILPPMDELDKQISQETLKAVAQYVQMKEQQKQQAQITGQQVPPFNAQELMPIVAQLQKQIATPTEKIVKKTPQVVFKEPKKQRQKK